MKKLRLVPGLVALAALAFTGSISADEHEEEPDLTSVWVMVPKEGMEGQFREALAEHMALRAEEGDSRYWAAFYPVLGDKLNVIQLRSCCFDWADQDAYDAENEEKGFGDHWNENVHQYVDHYHHYFDRMDREHSHWPEGMDGPYYGVTTWYANQTGLAKSGDARRKISKILIDEGWASDTNNWLWLFQIGGKPQTVLVSSYGSYAEMENPAVSAYDAVKEKVGEEKADKLFEHFSSGYSGSNYTIWKYDPSISSVSDDEGED